MLFNKEYKNYDNDDFDAEKTIDDVPEERKNDSRKESPLEQDNYNREREIENSGEKDLLDPEQIPSGDGDPAEHLNEIFQNSKKEPETFSQITRQPRGWKDSEGKFHSTEPDQIWESGSGEVKTVKNFKKISSEERENLIKKHKEEERKQRQKEAIEWLKKHPEEKK